jgi:NAD(P)-dependent dehydrogenase (short-subunit alcohol dehydrogenase family)
MSVDSFDGRYCLITGSSRGIGLAAARSIARRGAAVILHGRDSLRLRAECEKLRDPSRHRYVTADLAKVEEVLYLADEVSRRQGRLDVLIHCAGELGPRVPVGEYPPDEWNRVLQVNLTAPFLLTRNLRLALRQGENPTVVFVSSGAGRSGKPGWGAYAVSKFGLEGLAQVLAAELEPEGIRVNTVDPGPTRTRMRARAYPDEDPLTLPTPEEITPVFVHLATPDCRIHAERLEARAFSTGIGEKRRRKWRHERKS